MVDDDGKIGPDHLQTARERSDEAADHLVEEATDLHAEAAVLDAGLRQLEPIDVENGEQLPSTS